MLSSSKFLDFIFGSVQMIQKSRDSQPKVYQKSCTQLSDLCTIDVLCHLN